MDVEERLLPSTQEEVTDAESSGDAALLRKIDWTLVPVLCVTYGLQFSDKLSMAYSAAFGFRKDLGLVGQQYSWLSTIFYIAFLIFEFPANLAMQRLPIGKFLSVMCLIWGAMVMLIAACSNWSQLMVVRFIMGAAECSITPGFLLIIGSYYKTHEHATRSLLFLSMNTGFSMFTGLVTYQLGAYTQAHNGVAAWKAVNLFLGSMTVAWSMVLFVLLGTPDEVWWLKSEERKAVKARILSTVNGSSLNRAWDWDQAHEAFVDPQTWFLCGNLFFSSIPNGGIQSFWTLLTISFGFSPVDSILIGIPASATGFVYTLSVMSFLRRHPSYRMSAMGFSVIPPFVAFVVLATLSSDVKWRWVKMGMQMLASTFAVAAFLGFALVASNVGGRTKKSIVSAMMFICYCVANIIGAQIFREKDAPRYVVALLVGAACFVAELGCIVFGWRHYVKENKRRDRLAAASGLSAAEQLERASNCSARDSTDVSNTCFRYAT